MKIVLGLGNPGARYRWNRHNLGFRVVDLLAERREVALAREGDLGEVAWTAETRIGVEPVVLAKPRTFMNRSGRAGIALLSRYDAAPHDLRVVHDDADLALGRVRIRSEGSAGGHNGLRSLIDSLRADDFPRVKLGVRGARRDEVDLAEYVLEDFEPDEREVADALVRLGAEAVEAAVSSGLADAMNLFNGRGVGET